MVGRVILLLKIGMILLGRLGGFNFALLDFLFLKHHRYFIFNLLQAEKVRVSIFSSGMQPIRALLSLSLGPRFGAGSAFRRPET